MLKTFFKYQSIGNDFVIFDWFKRSEQDVKKRIQSADWGVFVKKTCRRHFGIGADCVLIIKKNLVEGIPELIVYNADGTKAENCLNGLRCVAHHLLVRYDFPPTFSIKVGRFNVTCLLISQGTIDRKTIITVISNVRYEEVRRIEITAGIFNGHVVFVGNPHFIVFKQVRREWLRLYGYEFEQHSSFVRGTNVEIVWQETSLSRNICGKKYHMIIYERGCGLTLGCGSGAAAVAVALFDQKKIVRKEKIELSMPGGSIEVWIDEKHNVSLKAISTRVFQGSF